MARIVHLFSTHRMKYALRSKSLLTGSLLIALRLATAAGDGTSIDVAAELMQGPGGMAVTPDGTMFISLHQFFETRERVVKVDRLGDVTAFPNDEVSTGQSKSALPVLDSVMGVRDAEGGIIWMLDNGRRGESLPKLIGWNVGGDRLHQVHYLPAPATLPTSFLVDFAVDPSEPFIYIADPASGTDAALIVLDLRNGLARRVLQSHDSVVPEKQLMIVNGKKLQVKRPDGTEAEPLAGVNPITIDRRGRWLYYGPMKGRQLYRISTSLLRNEAATPTELEEGVELYSSKPDCDSIAIDARDNIYVGDLSLNAIRIIQPKTRRMETFVKDPKLCWPDGLTFGGDGRLYFYCNQLSRSSAFNQGEDVTSAPFAVYRIKPLHQPLLVNPLPKRNPLTGITEQINDRLGRE
tara:strand:+ start:5065 stop:6285 length:1221 start_codon:yes stop_codon:yes gene_type:complete